MDSPRLPIPHDPQAPQPANRLGLTTPIWQPNNSSPSTASSGVVPSYVAPNAFSSTVSHEFVSTLADEFGLAEDEGLLRQSLFTFHAVYVSLFIYLFIICLICFIYFLDWRRSYKARPCN
jgi:hypothetical protein